jgi:hypothetical protein
MITGQHRLPRFARNDKPTHTKAFPWTSISNARLIAWRSSRVAEQLHHDFPAITDQKLVLVYPDGGLLPIRAWPPAYYKQLCSQLLTDGYAVALIGLPDARPLAQEIMSHCQHALCIDLTVTTKPGSCGIFRSCRPPLLIYASLRMGQMLWQLGLTLSSIIRVIRGAGRSTIQEYGKACGSL